MATTQSLMEAAVELARARRKADLDDLVEELRIPSISTLPDRRDYCLRNARWLSDRFAAMDMQTEIVDVREGGLPVVMAEWNGRPGKPHLTIYGHYDVQPVDPVEEWKSPPFEPAIREGQPHGDGESGGAPVRLGGLAHQPPLPDRGRRGDHGAFAAPVPARARTAPEE